MLAVCFAISGVEGIVGIGNIILVLTCTRVATTVCGQLKVDYCIEEIGCQIFCQDSGRGILIARKYLSPANENAKLIMNTDGTGRSRTNVPPTRTNLTIIA